MEKLTALIKEVVATIAHSTKKPLIGWDEDSYQFTIQVDPNDQGRMIGKSGVTVSAINVVMWHAGLQQIGHAVGIRLLEPDSMKKEIVSVPFMPKDNLDLTVLKHLVVNLLDTTLGKSNYTCAFTANIREPITAHICIKNAMEPKITDPDLITALKVVIKTAGRSCGGIVDSVIYFNK
jgi:predicted RNA-binding protein YlqC (UPF0109 family)